MEEESLCCSLSGDVDSVFQLPDQDLDTPVKNQHINGEQGTIVWGETEMQMNQSHGTDRPNLSQEAGRESPEEAERWEQIVWPVRPMSCSGASLSCATVQWDMPGVSDETPTPMTDGITANKFDSRGVTGPDSAPLPLYRHEDIKAEEEAEEQDAFDPPFLDLEWTGNGVEPCDAEDVQELTTQEQEESDGLLKSKNEISQGADSDEEEGEATTLDRPETADLINSLEELECSEDDGDSFVDVKLEEEREEPDVLLTAQENSGEEQTSANGVEPERTTERRDGEEEPSRTDASCTEGSDEEVTGSYLCVGELPVKQLKDDDTELTLNTDKLQVQHLDESYHCDEDREELELVHEDTAVEEPEMCKDDDRHAALDRLTPADHTEETSIEAAGQRIEENQAELELTENVEETSCLEKDCNQTTSEDREPSPHPESEGLQTTKEPEQVPADVSHQPDDQNAEDSELLGQSQQLDQSPRMELTEQSIQPENVHEVKDSIEPQEIVGVNAGDPEADQQEQIDRLTEQNEGSPQTVNTCQPCVPEQPGMTIESEVTEQARLEMDVAQQVEAQPSHHTNVVGQTEDGGVQTVVANGEQPKPLEKDAPQVNGGEVDREMARRLAERLFKLDGIPRVDVVKHLDKDNHFSHAVGEEYLKFFDFTGQTLDQALRSFLKVVILIGETQERERVLQHFACRFDQCNPDTYASSGSVLALTCAVMLLNTDLHGQHVGKAMSCSKFVSNLEGMNEGKNFNKDLLKILYNSIKNEPLEWAVDDEELKSSVLLEEDSADDAPMRSKANPFLDVPHDKNASVVKEGFLQRKLHADVDGKRTPWGKRGWKALYGLLRGMVLYLQKDDYRKDQPVNEEVVSVHHSLAEQAADYTKKPHVFRLQTADWRVFLFQASSKVEMNSWINRINLVSALHSSPPFPAAVGSQRKFFRPILPASQSAHTLERQLQSHKGMLESFRADLSYLQQNPPEGKKARTKDLEEQRIRSEYLQHEMTRYETYIQVLQCWMKEANAGDNALNQTELILFDKSMCADSVDGVDEEEGSLKKSYSSPSLEVEVAAPIVVKVRRNISERRTYRRTIVPRWNKEA